MRQLLDQLQEEWNVLARSQRATRALADWAADPALAGFSDLEAVIAETQRRGRPAESDRILLALLRRAPHDNLAARTVLQTLMPGLKTLMSAYQLTGEREEVAAAVIEAAFERISRYPCERRPARVAANLLNDTRQVLWRANSRQRRLEAVTEPLTDVILDRAAHEPHEPSSTDELVDLVDEAVRDGHVSRSGARLILLSRVLDVALSDLADEAGVKPQTLRKRRRRAEARLAAQAVA